MRRAASSKSVVEEAVLAWIESLGYQIPRGPEIAPDERGSERGSDCDVVLAQQLRSALSRLNPDLGPDPVENAFRNLARPEWPSLYKGPVLPVEGPGGVVSRLGLCPVEQPAASAAYLRSHLAENRDKSNSRLLRGVGLRQKGMNLG